MMELGLRPERLQYGSLVLRRRRDKEQRVYNEIFPYSSADYEVLLRHWPTEPYLNYLAALYTPGVTTDPESSLVKTIHEWTSKLANSAGYSNRQGIEGVRAAFLTVTGGSLLPVVSGDTRITDMFLTYIIPTTCQGSQVVSCYPPDSFHYCKFYSLQCLLQDMYSNVITIHPSTKEMLATLDSWLNERHAQPHFLNQLFQPPISQRAVATVTNPLHEQGSTNEIYEEFKKKMEEEPVDKYIDNPLFGSGLAFNDEPDKYFVNEYFGMGKPDYQAIGTKTPQWTIESGTDWVEQFPLHKFACEGDVAGIRHCMAECIETDPNVLDTDGWSPLHYACWYGELDVVFCLIQECMANVEVQNDTGATPLHLAAGNGHKYVVDYLLKCPGTVVGAVDKDGRTPLAACLANKSNDWRMTEHLLRGFLSLEHVDTPKIGNRRSTIHDDDPEVFEEDEMAEKDEELDQRGSLANIADGEDTLKKPSTVSKVDISFMNGHHQVVNFYKGKITPALDALQDVFRLIRLDLSFQYAFALWIVSKNLAIQLGDTDKPLKIISKWPSLMNRFSKSDSNETPHLYLRRNVFLAVSQESTASDPVALQYLYFDALNHVLSGYYPTTEEEALQLATTTMQLKYGDYNSAIHNLKFIKDRLTALVPASAIKGKKRLQFERRLLTKYEHQMKQREHNNLILYDKYLQICRKWPYYGATFYEGNVTTKVHKMTEVTSQIKQVRKLSVKIGINAFGFHFINKDSNVPMESYPLDGMKWDMKEKCIFSLEALDGALTIIVYSKQTFLLYSMSTQMKKELDTVKINFMRPGLKSF